LKRKLQKKQIKEQKYNELIILLNKTIQSLGIKRNIQKEIVELIKIRKDYSDVYYTGNFYGYPKCCINDFIHNHCNNKKPSKQQELAGGYTGFVPCLKCTPKILSGKIELSNLINNRIFEKPFPIDEESEYGFVPCKKHALLMFLNKIHANDIIRTGCNKCIIGEKCLEDINEENEDNEDNLENDCCNHCKI